MGGPVCRVQKVIDGQHHSPALNLCRLSKGHMDRHLVSVKVRVVGMTHKGMQLDRLTLDQNRLKSLNTKPVQGGRTVQKHRMLPHNLVKNSPDLRGLLLNQGFCLFDVIDDVLFDELLHDKGLVQLQSHLGRKPALMHPKLRSHNDYRTAGIVDPLTQQVLPEPPLLTLKHIREGLERPVRGPLDHPFLFGVVEKCVHRLLKHPLFVPDNDIRGHSTT